MRLPWEVEEQTQVIGDDGRTLEEQIVELLRVKELAHKNNHKPSTFFETMFHEACTRRDRGDQTPLTYLQMSSARLVEKKMDEIHSPTPTPPTSEPRVRTYEDFLTFCESIMDAMHDNCYADAKNTHVETSLLLKRTEQTAEFQKALVLIQTVARFYNPEHVYDSQDMINFGYHLLRER